MQIWDRRESACVRMVCDSWSVGWTLFAHKPIATKVAIRESRGKMPIDRLLIANRFDRWSMIADSSLFDHFDLCAPLKKNHAKFQSGWTFWILITFFCCHFSCRFHSHFFNFNINFLFLEIYCSTFFFLWFFKWNGNIRQLDERKIYAYKYFWSRKY